MVRNVLTGWASYTVLIATGFVLPRLIDRHVGQTALGVWDFAWSVVSYFGLVQLGLGSTVNRFVAGTRAAGDLERLRGAVSTVSVMLAALGAVIAALTVGTAAALPWLFGARLGVAVAEAQTIVLLLGLGLAFQNATDAFNGVITGCHRWDLHNGIAAGFQAAQVSAMIAVLSLDGGLVGLAWATVAGIIGTQVVRAVVAFRVCPGLRLSPSYVSREMAWTLLSFGGKSFVPKLAILLADQTTNILIVGYLGPAALAVYSRPRGLLRHVGGVVSRYAFVLEPTVGSMHATGDVMALRALLLRAVSIGGYLSLPMTLVLLFFGDAMIQVWMGPNYAAAEIMAVMTLGAFVGVSQMPVGSILLGMNEHGRSGLATLLASATSAGLAFLVVGVLGWGLLGAALAVTIPGAVVAGVYVPARACRLLNVSLAEYLAHGWRRPIWTSLPFAIALALARWWLPQPTVMTLLACLAPAGLILAVTYWQFVLPPATRSRIWERTWRVIQAPLRLGMARTSSNNDKA
jgi:O-antigen/teichoic acid export membrane protein